MLLSCKKHKTNFAFKTLNTLIVTLVLFSLPISGFTSANDSDTPSFLDTQGHWAEERIGYMSERGFVSGHPGGMFKPDAKITRAEFASLLGNTLNIPREEIPIFPDLKENHWAHARIGGLVKTGIINTDIYSSNYFPDGPITREEISMMVFGVMNKQDNKQDIEDISIELELPDFEDTGSISRRFMEYVSFSTQEEIQKGYPDGTFRPSDTATRAESVAVIHRILEALAPEEYPQKKIGFHFIDVGQGDAILIDSPCDTYILVDGGPRHAGDDLVAYLNELGVDRIEKVIATHEHADHVGGLIAVYESPIEVGTTYTSKYEHDTIPAKEFRGLAKEHSRVEYPEALDTLNMDSIDVTFLHPYEEADDSDIHYMNLVVNIQHGDFSVLLTGGAEAEVEKAILNNPDLEEYVPSTILKAGHHGSSTSTSELFLDAVDPDTVVIQCGVDNKYGHPHEETLENLEIRGIEVKRTDLDGTVIIYSDYIKGNLINKEAEYQKSLKNIENKVSAVVMHKNPLFSGTENNNGIVPESTSTTGTYNEYVQRFLPRIFSEPLIDLFGFSK